MFLPLLRERRDCFSLKLTYLPGGALAEDLIAAETKRSAKRARCSCGHDHEGECGEE